MRMSGAKNRLLMSATVMLLTVAASASTEDLELLHGIYVLESFDCDDSPNAAVISWDGVGFSGAHSSACTSQVNRRVNGHYEITTSCMASGDDTPNPAGKADQEFFLLTRLSATQFSVVKSDGRPMTYRWCGDESSGSN